MPARNARQRPVRAGIQVTSARSTTDGISSGTLTALATHNNQKVLVTCQHVMAGTRTVAGISGYFNSVSRDEKMYQHDRYDAANLIGDTAIAIPFTLTGLNQVDAAYVRVIDERHVSFWLHDEPTHTDRLLIAGTVEPEVDMEVKILGKLNGEYNVTIRELNVESPLGGHPFSDLVEFERPSHITDFMGDSGAPVVKETAPDSGLYQMVGIFVGGFGRSAWICKASNVESQLGITFGKRDPIARAFVSPEHSSAGETVRLDGSNSRDPDNFGHDVIYPDRRDLIFAWEQISGPDVENLQILPNGIAVFTVPTTVPEDARRPIRFRLTVTDTYDLQATTEVRANRKPIVNVAHVVDGEANVIDGAISAVVDTEVTLDASGSWDPDGDRLFFSWDQPGASDLIIPAEQRTERRVAFTPTEQGRLVFDLTVSDGLGGASTQRVTVNVVPPPPVAHVGENRQEDTGVTVTLDGSKSTPMEGLTYSWVVDEPTHGVTLVDANTARPYFTSPVEDVDVTFTLTVTDGMDRTATASVTLQFRDTWSDWQDVVPIQHQGEGHEREKQQFSTSDLGKTKYRWEPDPEEIWPDEWTNTDVYKNEDGKRWRKQVRISNLGNEHPDPNWIEIGDLDWGDWEFVRHEGSGASRMRVEQRTTTYSSHNTTETREVPDPEEIWPDDWTNTDVYKNEDGKRWRKQVRISNLGNEHPDPNWIEIGDLDWGDWEFVRHEGSGASRVRVEQRTTT